MTTTHSFADTRLDDTNPGRELGRARVGLWLERTYNLSLPLDMLRYVARHRFGWPGGYSLHVVYHDGNALCYQCVRDLYRDEIRNITGGWTQPDRVCTGDIDRGRYCDHCGRDLSDHENEGE